MQLTKWFPLPVPYNSSISENSCLSVGVRRWMEASANQRFLLVHCVTTILHGSPPRRALNSVSRLQTKLRSSTYSVRQKSPAGSLSRSMMRAIVYLRNLSIVSSHGVRSGRRSRSCRALLMQYFASPKTEQLHEVLHFFYFIFASISFHHQRLPL